MSNEFKEPLVGRRIVGLRRMTKVELENRCWDYPDSVCDVVELDDGTFLYAQTDEEGNGVGCMIRSTPRGDFEVRA